MAIKKITKKKSEIVEEPITDDEEFEEEEEEEEEKEDKKSKGKKGEEPWQKILNRLDQIAENIVPDEPVKKGVQKVPVPPVPQVEEEEEQEEEEKPTATENPLKKVLKFLL